VDQKVLIIRQVDKPVLLCPQVSHVFLHVSAQLMSHKLYDTTMSSEHYLKI
jgi:hypothetical protein